MPICRRIEEADVAGVALLEKELFTVPWSENSIFHDAFETPASRWLVLESEDHRLLGYAALWLVIDEGHILKVAIRKDEQRKGYGKILFTHLIELAKEEGMRLLTLEVRRSNLAAQTLYHRCGMLDVGYRKRYYEDNKEDALIMYMDLV